MRNLSNGNWKQPEKQPPKQPGKHPPKQGLAKQGNGRALKHPTEEP